MRSKFLPLLGFAVLLAAPVLHAHEAKHGALHLTHPHAAPVIEGGTTELQLTISNEGAADQLIGVETEMATNVELSPVKIPAKAKNLAVKAKLIGAKREYLDTEMIPATFIFAKAGRVAEDIMIDR